MSVSRDAIRQHLVERYRALDQVREQARRELRARLEPALVRVSAAYGVERAILFGSLAGGEFGERSDVDLLVWGVRGAGLDELGAALATDLGRSVHVISAETAPEGLVARVLEEGEELRVA